MTHSPFWLRRPNQDELALLLAEQRTQDVTYAPVGGTRTHEAPGGFRLDRWSTDLGREADAFDLASQALRRWAVHRGAGIEVLPPAPSIATGETVVLGLSQPPFFATAACRVVWIVDEADSFGFGYGTLPHHPERGEESFVVERDATGNVVFEITAFSRPAHALARLGGPVGRAIQSRTTRRYLRAMEAWLASPSTDR